MTRTVPGATCVLPDHIEVLCAVSAQEHDVAPQGHPYIALDKQLACDFDSTLEESGQQTADARRTPTPRVLSPETPVFPALLPVTPQPTSLTPMTPPRYGDRCFGHRRRRSQC